jgi:hypothetical protein
MHGMSFSHCLVGIVVAGVLLVSFGVGLGTLMVTSAALACPLMMVLMMRGMHHGSGDHDRPR